MIQAGQKHSTWMVLKPSGMGFCEVSNGKEVLKVSSEDIERGNFKGDLMYKVAPSEKPKKKNVKKTKKVD